MQDVIKQLLTVDYKKRFNFDELLKHIWFEKDILMKQKVNDLIAEFDNILKSNLQLVPSYNKENIAKKIRFCDCFSHASTSDSEC